MTGVEHKPGRTDWFLVGLTVLLLLAIFLLTSYHQEFIRARQAGGLAAAEHLASLQHGRLANPTPETNAAARAHLQTGGANISNYQAKFKPTSDRQPEVVVCTQPCKSPKDKVHLRLAYGHRLHYGPEINAWDFWFAPTANGHWVSDRLRLLYRIIPGKSQSDYWGLLREDWTGGAFGFREDKLARLPGLGRTPVADFLHKVVRSWRIQGVNFIGAPTSALAFSSDDSPVRGPYWQSAGSFVDNVIHAVHDLVNNAAADAQTLDLSGVASLLAALLVILGALSRLLEPFYRAWRSVLRFLSRRYVEQWQLSHAARPGPAAPK